MTAETIEDRVRRVVADIFDLPLETVDSSTSRDTVEGWDSMNLVNLMLAVESEFDIVLEVDDVQDLLSVPLIVAVLKEKGL